MRTLFGSILSRSMKETGTLDRGWDWLRRFDGQTKEYVQNPALLMEKLNRREGMITVWELTDMLWQAKRGRSEHALLPLSHKGRGAGGVRSSTGPRSRPGRPPLALGPLHPRCSDSCGLGLAAPGVG